MHSHKRVHDSLPPVPHTANDPQMAALWAAENSCLWRTLSAAASSTKRDGSRSFFFTDGLRATAGFAVRFAAARFGRRAQCFLYWRVAFLRVVTLPFCRHAAAMSPPLASAAAKMAPSPSACVVTMPASHEPSSSASYQRARMLRVAGAANSKLCIPVHHGAPC